MTPTIWCLRKRHNYSDNKNITVCQGLWGRKEGQKSETQRIFREQREKNQLTIYVEVCLWTPFCSTDLCVYPSINTVLCIVYGIGDIYSRPKNHDTSSFILFLSFFLLLHLQHMKVPWARDQIRAAAAGLCHSHSNVGSQLHLQPTLQLEAMQDPQPTERGQRSNPHSQGHDVRFLTHWTTTGTPSFSKLLWFCSSIWILESACLYLQKKSYWCLFICFFGLFYVHTRGTWRFSR